MTPQSSFMIVDTIREGQLDALRSLLASMNQLPGHADPENTLVPFKQFSGLHDARFVIITANTADDIRAFGHEPHSWRPALAFLGNVDGDAEIFLAELAVRAGPGLTRLFSHCENFRERHGDELLSWMKQHQKKAAASYANWRGRTVVQIQEEGALHRSLANALPEILENTEKDKTGHHNARAIRQKLLSHIQKEQHTGVLTLSPPGRTPLRWCIGNVLHLLCVPALLLLAAPFLLLALPFIAWRLRHHERTDPEIDIRPTTGHITQLSVQEDLDVTNQFNIFGDVKPGWFRLYLLKFILMIINYTTHHIYIRGFLARVRTIHFARWVLLNDNRQLCFASTYDGSLESYMDDFINKVAFGLNLVFSHGVAYPGTRWIVKDGAEFEQKFKNTLRRHQLPSEVWYRAYPGVTAYDMHRNSCLRTGVEQYPESEQAVRDWLSLI